MQDNHVRKKTRAIACFYERRGDEYTATLVSRCGYGNRCRVRHCPICEHTRARDRFRQVINTYIDLFDQHPRMQQPQIVTMTTGNTPIEFIGSCGFRGM